MRQILSVSLLLFVATLLSGCAGVSGGAFGGATPVSGWAFTGVTVPSQRLHAPLDTEVTPKRVGKASAYNVLGLVGVGDASVKTAMEDGNITKIHHVDHQIFSILGIYATWGVKVYGE